MRLVVHVEPLRATLSRCIRRAPDEFTTDAPSLEVRVDRRVQKEGV